MENNFLNDLKKSLDSGGEYNSEAAKKIMEITELSESKKGDISSFIKDNKKEAVDKKTAMKVNADVKANLVSEKEKAEIEVLKLISFVKNLEKKVYDSINDLSEAYDKISSKLYPKRDEFTENEQNLFDLVSSPIIDIDRILNNEEYRNTKFSVSKKDIENLDIDKLVETGEAKSADGEVLPSENLDEESKEETNN